MTSTTPTIPTIPTILSAIVHLCEAARERGPVRAALRSGLSESSGLHLSSLERLVDLWLETCTPQALGEIADLAQRHAPVGTVGIVAPGNLCVAAWQPMIEALLCGDRLVVRPGRGDRRAPGNLRRALQLIAPSVAERIEIADFERQDSQGWGQLLGRVDALSVHGSDEAVEALRALAAEAHFRGIIRAHGHKISLALLPASTLCDSSALRRAAAEIAHDTLLGDGRGCMSARAVLLEGLQDAERWAEIIQVFEIALREAAQRFSLGQLAPALQASRRLWIEAARFDAAMAPAEVQVLEDREAGWALVSYLRPTSISLSKIGPGARALSLFSLPSPLDLPTALAPTRPHLAALARPAAAAALIDPQAHLAGVDRCCDLGRLQAPLPTIPPDSVPLGYGFLRS